MDAAGWEDDTWILHDLTVPIDLADREEGRTRVFRAFRWSCRGTMSSRRSP